MQFTSDPFSSGRRPVNANRGNLPANRVCGAGNPPMIHKPGFHVGNAPSACTERSTLLPNLQEATPICNLPVAFASPAPFHLEKTARLSRTVPIRCVTCKDTAVPAGDKRLFRSVRLEQPESHVPPSAALNRIRSQFCAKAAGLYGRFRLPLPRHRRKRQAHRGQASTQIPQPAHTSSSTMRRGEPPMSERGEPSAGLCAPCSEQRGAALR